MPNNYHGLRELLGHESWGLSENQVAALANFMNLLVEANKKVHIVSTQAAAHISDHIVDSLHFLDCGFFEARPSVADVGSGGGLPGLVLAIARPLATFFLIESQGAKTEFLRHIVTLLGLENVTVETARVEDIGRAASFRERFDVVTVRAVARLAVLLEYGMPLLVEGGRLVAAKGAKASEEVAEAEAAARELGGELEQLVSVGDEPLSKKQLVVYRKIAETLPRYPRRRGIPKKRPIGG